jgi:hypothetical protein
LPPKGGEFFKGQQEGILGDIAGELRGPNNVYKGSVEAVLVPFDQQPKRLRATPEAAVDQFLVRGISHRAYR